MKHDEAGLTIIETLIAMFIASIMSALLIVVTINLYGATLKQQLYSEMILESQQVLTRMMNDVKFSDKIFDANTIVDPNKTGGWTTSAPVLVVGEPAFDSNRNFIYESATGYPYKNEVIYFLNNNSMYRRTLKNTNAVGNTAVTSCPVSTASCSLDIKLASRVSSLSFIFYDANNAVTATPTLARSIQVSIVMSGKVYGQTVTLTNTVRGTLRNN